MVKKRSPLHKRTEKRIRRNLSVHPFNLHLVLTNQEERRAGWKGGGKEGNKGSKIIETNVTFNVQYRGLD